MYTALTVHDFAVHYIAHYIAEALHHITSDYITSHYITLHYMTLHEIMDSWIDGYWFLIIMPYRETTVFWKPP